MKKFRPAMNQHLQIDNYYNKSGFTLFEFLTVMMIIAIILLLAIPTFDTIVKNNRIENEGYRIFTMLRQTRSNAITFNRRNFLCRSNNATTDVDGSGAACNTTGANDYDWNMELMSYTLLANAPEVDPNALFDNQKLEVVGVASTDAEKQQMLQSIRGSDSDAVNVIASSDDNVIAFTPEGALLNDAPIRIAVCDDRGTPENFGQLITINAAGLIRLSNTDVTDTELDCTPNP